MTVISPDRILHAAEPVGDTATWLARLRARGEPVALGIDCPIGLPRAYAALHAAESDFPAFLRALSGKIGFLEVAAGLEEVTGGRPFYPARGVRGMTRLSHARALGLTSADELCRACDRATGERPAGAPVFWTLGANQSGKAAISAWREVLGPALLADEGVRLWPFEGAFRDLLALGGVVVAETYPAEAMRHLRVVLRGSKRRQADRAGVAGQLAAAMARLGVVADAGGAAAIADGFGGDAAGEDRFDSVLGALCVLGVVRGERGDEAPADPWVRRWEGWVLGQEAPFADD